MNKILWVNTLLCFFFLIITSLYAAPIRPLGPFDIAGTISEVQWIPDEFRKGRPGWSGSLGHDRTDAAHFVIKLIEYRGIDAAEAIRITRYISFAAYGGMNPDGRPPFIILKIHSKDGTLLKKGMKIWVTGYSVQGDEGGIRASHTGLKIQRM